MNKYDILENERGKHIRILLIAEPESYVVDCKSLKMPYTLANSELETMKAVDAESYALFVIDDDIDNKSRDMRDRRFEIIRDLLDERYIYDKSARNKAILAAAEKHKISRRTLIEYLWKYWVYESKNALLPKQREAGEKQLTQDEKTIRWALNKFYYSPQKHTLPLAYKMMLQAKYCDERGKLLNKYPSFWQFRYFFRQHRDRINETISRQGITAYQRNHRAFTGSVRDYTGTVGTFMTDATIADIYIVNRISRKPIGRPIIYTMVDAYSSMITGVYVGLEGGQYALRLLLQNTCMDKVEYCKQYGIDISAEDWPSHHLPQKILTDRGPEFLGGPLENICETYHVEVENLPSYRPDLKGPVEKLFDLIQNAYKPLLKGKGVVEENIQERGAPDYRRQGTLDLGQFTQVIIRCVIFFNTQNILRNFKRTPQMIQQDIPPTAASIWRFCMESETAKVQEVNSKKFYFTLLPRADGKMTQRGLEFCGLTYSNDDYKKRFVNAGFNGRENVTVAFLPECMDNVYLYENGAYTSFDLMQQMYRGKTLAEVLNVQKTEKQARADWDKEEIQAHLDLMRDISDIASRAGKGNSDTTDIGKKVRTNRKIAKKQEDITFRNALTDERKF